MVSATRVSRCVRERLGAGGRAVVVGIQRRACHVAIDPDGLLILSAPDIPLAPNAIAVESAPDELRVGHTVALLANGQGDGEADWLVDLQAAAVWDPRPSVGPVPAPELGDRLRTARATAIAEGSRESLLALLWGSSGHTAALRRACVPARLLTEAATRGDAPSVAAAAAGLAGLGPGLTPSGDDLLAGFAAAWTLVGESLGQD
ncbi:MAG: DUF2877 domain-containing protein, partial [Candidatus Rokuibacteriota bacterium]